MSKRKLAQTPEAFEAQARSFLSENGFPENQLYLTLYGSMIQHSSADDDTIDEELIAKRIRKQVANELAFFLMYPERRAKQDESEAVPASSEEVVQKT